MTIENALSTVWPSSGLIRQQVVGVVSEKDFLKKMGFGTTPSFMQLATHCLRSKGCIIHKLHNKTIGDIMTTPAITGDSTITIGSISTLFAAHQINQGYIMNTLKKLCSMQYSINDQRKIEISGTEF